MYKRLARSALKIKKCTSAVRESSLVTLKGTIPLQSVYFLYCVLKCLYNFKKVYWFFRKYHRSQSKALEQYIQDELFKAES